MRIDDQNIYLGIDFPNGRFCTIGNKNNVTGLFSIFHRHKVYTSKKDADNGGHKLVISSRKALRELNKGMTKRAFDVWVDNYLTLDL